jgi:hypothetical protein
MKRSESIFAFFQSVDYFVLFFLFVIRMRGWMDGWMDGWMEGGKGGNVRGGEGRKE